MFESKLKKYDLNICRHSPHAKIISYVPNGSIVLDVGCNRGYIGKELKKKGCRSFGIDIDCAAACEAAPFYEEVIAKDIKVFYPKNYQETISWLRLPDYENRLYGNCFKV